MFRILIADDEGIMLKSIEHTILSNFKSECEVLCVKSGRAFVEAAENFHPDIAFVDIHMPGLNGIQAIKEVKKFNNSTVYIIITAYDKFSYAQEAINLGVLEFITKPVTKDKIIDVCIKAMKEVSQNRKKLSDNLKIREKLELVIPIIENSFIYSVVQDDVENLKDRYLNILDIKKENGFIINIQFNTSQKNNQKDESINASIAVNNSYSQIKGIIKDFFDSIVGPIMGNKIIVFVPFEKEDTEYEERVEFITRSRNMIYTIENKTNIHFRCGIGKVYKIDQIKKSYTDSQNALRNNNSHIVHITDIQQSSKSPNLLSSELEDKYITAAIKTKKDRAVNYANEIFDIMQEQSSNAENIMKLKVLELIILLEKKAIETENIENDLNPKKNYLEEIQLIDDNRNLRKWFVNKTIDICNKISDSSKSRYDDVIFKAKTFINENFHNDISLDEVSRIVDISPYYFSKLFKQKVGKTFIEYLTSLRIQKAQSLLDNPTLSIKEICIMSGYSDPNYFSRIFKKYQGNTPSEYRERLKNEKDKL